MYGTGKHTPTDGPVDKTGYVERDRRRKVKLNALRAKIGASTKGAFASSDYLREHANNQRKNSSTASSTCCSPQHPLGEEAGLLHGSVAAPNDCQRLVAEQRGATVADGAGADALLPELLGACRQW
jgi:hypothetical protein